MAKKSGLLERQRERDHIREMIIRDLVGQFDADTIIIAMNLELGIGYDRLMRVLKRWSELRDQFVGALAPNVDPEGDVKQEHLDAVIRGIMERAGKGDQFQPFRERYPQIDDISYMKRWKQ